MNIVFKFPSDEKDLSSSPPSFGLCVCERNIATDEQNAYAVIYAGLHLKTL